MYRSDTQPGKKNSKLTTSLETSDNKLLTVCQEVEDKDNEIKVISDQNKGLNSKIAKLVKKADQLQEELELQLAFQHNLDLKTTTPEALTANKPNQKQRTICHRLSSLDRKRVAEKSLMP